MADRAPKIVVVGGVAGGASAAARARRLSEHSEIIVFERGPYVSFANCGLPYYIGGEITDRKKLLVQTPESLRARLALDVRVNTEVVAIDPSRRVITFRRPNSNSLEEETYDKLVLSTGSFPLRPNIPGIDRPGLFTLRDVPDTDQIFSWVEAHPAGKAVVIGGGFIGLEMAEQLHRRGLTVTVIEALPQLLAPLDPELAGLVECELAANGVTVQLGDAVAAFEAPSADETAAASVVVTNSGARFPADLILLGIGVRPETTLAKQVGLALGPSGGILVNEFLETSLPGIFAVGDAIEVRGFGLDIPSLIPLAGPANRQGRMAADNIFGMRRTYRGTAGTAVVRVFGLIAAATGANEKLLKRQQLSFKSVSLHPGSHAGYYPGAQPIALKLTFDPKTRRILGAQAVGRDGVEKRIDVIATALQLGGTVDDLAELELCYAPPLGSAKDAVNLAGMAGQNVADEFVDVITAAELPAALAEGAVLLDVRDAAEVKAGTISGALWIPVNELRSRLDELPRTKLIVAYCASGLRSYLACRLLCQSGFSCKNLSGAYRTWTAAQR